MQHLIDSPAFCQALLEKTGQSFFAYDTQNKEFSYLSPSFQKVFQLQQDTCNVDVLLVRVHEEDRERVARKLAEPLSTQDITVVEFRIQLSKEAEQRVCLHASWLENAPGQHLVIGHAEDITAVVDRAVADEGIAVRGHGCCFRVMEFFGEYLI